MNNALFKEVQIRLEATLFFIGQGVAILIYCKRFIVTTLVTSHLKQQTSDSSWEFLKIENEQVNQRKTILMDKKLHEITNFGEEIVNSKRQVKGELGHVVQIRTCDLGITLRRLACANFVTWVAVFIMAGSFLALPTRKAIRYSMKTNPICELPLSRSARCTFAPLTLSLPNLSKSQISTKFPNFILWNFEKQIAPCVSTGRELLFEWSHHRIWSTD